MVETSDTRCALVDDFTPLPSWWTVHVRKVPLALFVVERLSLPGGGEQGQPLACICPSCLQIAYKLHHKAKSPVARPGQVLDFIGRA